MDKKEKYKNNGRNWFKDGRTKEISGNSMLQKLYYSWIGIRRREYGACFSSENRHKHIYANVTVAKEWQDWNIYKKWALANGYKEGLSIDRIDNSKGYCPENCRWVTIADNNRNRKNTRFYEYKGQKLTLGQIAEINNVNRCCLRNRVVNLGWSIEDAIKTPKWQYPNKHN